MAGSWGLGTGDWWLSRTVISSRARNLCHSRRGTYAFSTCAARLSAFLICLSYRLCPIRPYGHLPFKGKAADTRKPAAANLRASPHGLTLPTSFTTKSCALHSSLFYFFPFLTTVFASGFASALPRPRLPVFASFFAVMYQAGDLSVHLFCFTVESFGYCFL